MPFEALLRELRERDPAAYEKIDKQNPRRVIRAVEVIRLTGKKFSATTGGMEVRQSRQSTSPKHFFCFTRQPADLHARINARVDAMFARGLVDETRELLKHGLERKQNGDASHRLPAGGGTSARRTVTGGNHRTGENPHPAICQAATDLVPRSEKLWNGLN